MAEIGKWLDGSHVGTGLPVAVERALLTTWFERTHNESKRAIQRSY